MQAKSTTFIAIIMTTENREPSISLLFFIWIYIIIEDSDSTLTKYSLSRYSGSTKCVKERQGYPLP